MTGIQMTILVAKAAQSVKKLDPLREPAKNYHLWPVRKRC